MAFKCSKLATKTLGKSEKYVQREIIQRKMSGVELNGGKFSEWEVIFQRGTN